MGEVSEIKRVFLSNKIGVLDMTGDVSVAVAATDAYIGSNYSSVVNLFAVCGKPIYLFDCQIHTPTDNKRKKPEDVFCKNFEYDYFAAREEDEYYFVDFVNDIEKGRLEIIMNKQLDEVNDIAANIDGTRGEKFINYC